MKRWIIIALVAACIWLMVTFPHAMLNPGELVAGHQEMNNECQSCHTPFWGISSEKCMSCHKLSEIGKDSFNNNDSFLFHKNFIKQECTSCHSDHKGVHPSVPISFFDHGFLPVDEQTKCGNCHNQPADELHGKLSATCNSCHNTKAWKFDITFHHDMIRMQDQNNCISCHGKPNDAFHSSFNDNCAQCHSTEQWLPASFEHSSFFLLDQNHNAKCSTCHTGNNFSIYTCYGCHEHSESKIKEEHNEEGITDFSNCVDCHRSGNEHDIKYNIETKKGSREKEIQDVKNYLHEKEKNDKGKNDDD